MFYSLVYIASDDFTPTTPQTIVFESDSIVNETRCVEYEIIGDDFKELDETLTIDLFGDDPLDVIAGAAPISVIIENDQDCKCFSPSNFNITGSLSLSLPFSHSLTHSHTHSLSLPPSLPLFLLHANLF